MTFGGVTVGLCILAWRLMKWFPGIKSLRSSPVDHAGKLFPFFLAWSYGCLTTLGVGGLIGYLSGTVLGIGNWLGDVALFLGVGADWGKTSSGTFQPLSEYGNAVMLILSVVFVAAMTKDKYSSDLKMGACCGICLGTSAGVAGLAAAPLANVANWLGTIVYGAFQ